ncbi:MAG: YqeG family HAD IIIA-type phosphatase [Clostridia bacterium]|nr:YqeG family HAD IIIA-type phosphatase [Clostridia bacterium]
MELWYTYREIKRSGGKAGRYSTGLRYTVQSARLMADIYDVTLPKRRHSMCFLPDAFFQTFDQLTPQYLAERHINALIVDVDNTLIPYEENLPRSGVLKWLDEMKQAGISIAFVTNNHKKRLDTFNAVIGLPAFHDSLKPFPRNMKAAMRAMQSDAAHTANIGDQIFTDIWAGKLLGLRSYLVPPIKDKKDLFTKFKRFLEKPILKRFFKKQN